MGLIDNYINKRVTSVIARQQSAQFRGFNSNDLINFLSMGLPTLNADGYDYYNPYQTIGAVYEAVTLIAGKIQSAPIVFYKVKNKRKAEKAEQLLKSQSAEKIAQGLVMKQEALEEVEAPQLSQLLNKPNPYMDGDQFINTLAQCYLLRGNAYMYGNKVGQKAKELFLFPEMEIVTKINEYLDPILGYNLQISGYQQVYDKTDIYHFKTANPAEMDNTYQYLYGVAPLRAYLEPLRSIKEGYKQQSKMLNSGGVFGIVSPSSKEDQFSKEQRDSIKEALVEARQSKDELARLFASSISLDFNQIGLSANDLQLLESLKLTNEQIYKAYKIPVGYVSTDGNTYNNVETFKELLIYNAVVPICEAISSGLTEFVGKAYDNTVIKIDYSELPDLAGMREKVSKHLVALTDAGILSPNEARESLGYSAATKDYMNDHYYKGKLLTQPTNNNDTNNQSN
jgi:HK97 family phage portal protein